MNVMVDLDCLRDTRLITLSKLVPTENIDLVKWQRRICDVAFYGDLGVDYDKFQEFHSNRTLDYLRDDLTVPTLTPMVDYIRDQLRREVNDFQMDSNRLYLNIYPYKATPKQKSILTATLREMFYTFGVIEIVSFSRSALKPSVIRKLDVKFLVTYDGFSWYNQHADEIQDKPMPDFELITPKILYSKRDTSEDIKVPEGEDPFELLQMIYSLHLKFIFEPVSLFSLLLPLQHQKQ